MSIGEKIAPFLGRLMLSLFFIIWSWQKLSNFEIWAQFLADRNFPAPPMLLTLSAAVEFIAGLGLFLGYRTQLAALALFGYTIAVSVLLHDFWQLPEGVQRITEMQIFFRNMAIAGGLLVMTGLGGGAFSLDNRK